MKGQGLAKSVGAGEDDKSIILEFGDEMGLVSKEGLVLHGFFKVGILRKKILNASLEKTSS